MRGARVVEYAFGFLNEAVRLAEGGKQDVKIEGVSYVINFRKELESEIRATSLDAVIERLERDAGIKQPATDE